MWSRPRWATATCSRTCCGPDAPLGGEQSGHVIFRRAFDRPGDGLLTAVRFLSLAARTGRTIRELASVMHRYPQRHDQRRRVGSRRARRPPNPSGPPSRPRKRVALGQDGRVSWFAHPAPSRWSGSWSRRQTEDLASEHAESIADAVADRHRRGLRRRRGSGRSRTPALGLSGHVRHRGLRRARRGPSDRHRRSPPARVSRVRLGGHRRDRRRPRRRQACRQARRSSRPRSPTRGAPGFESAWDTRGGRPTARPPTATRTRIWTAAARSP